MEVLTGSDKKKNRSFKDPGSDFMIDIGSKKKFAPQIESKTKWVITMYRQKKSTRLILLVLLKSEGQIWMNYKPCIFYVDL